MMRAAVCIKVSSGAVGVLIFLACLANFFSQNTQPTPTPGGSPIPSPTSSRTPQPRPTPSPFPGAQNFHKWGSITVFNGLPSDSVRAIAQTADGVMWFGTDNGLARFDGRTINKVNLGDADANVIQTLAVSDQGLWIGTHAGAFFCSQGSVIPIPGTEGQGISAMSLDREDFLATEEGLVLLVQRGDGDRPVGVKQACEQLKQPDGTPTKITSLIQQAIGWQLNIGTSGDGAWVLDTNGLRRATAEPLSTSLNSLTLDDSGSLWIGSDAKKGESGVYHVEGNATKPIRIAAPTANILSLAANQSDVWAGSERYGLFQFSVGKLAKTYTFESTAGGLRSDTIFALFFDREGVLWIGTNRGVSRYDAEAPNQQTVSDIPNSNFIRTIFRSSDGKTLYAGSNRGLFSFDGKDWKPVAGFDNKVIYSILPTNNGIAVGTSTGTLGSNRGLQVDGDTRSLQTFQGDTYAAVFGRGVADITAGEKVIFNDSGPTALLASDRLWIGTLEHGLFSYDGKTVKNEIPHELLKSGTIWKIFESPDHVLWIAGQHGVVRVKDGQPEQVVAAEEVRDVYVDGSDVWAATTTRGLLHARRDDRFGWVVSSIGFEQGLPSDKVFSILPAKDGLLLATNRGVATYRSSTVAPKLIATRVLSQRLHDVNEFAQPIALDYPQKSLLVEVTGLSSRTFPEEFQYAFVLTNSKGDEIERRLSNDAEYSPSKLSPGDYKIEAIALNRDLVASEPLFIRFSIAKAPFPWTATALGVLLLLALVGLVWAFVEHRRMRQRNRDLAAARLDLANEAERERRRIARDLHDQTLADLRNLMMMSDKLTPEHPEFRSEIENVSSEIRRICEDLSPSVLENVGLVAALQFLVEHTIESSRFIASDDLDERIDLPLNVQLQIYRIAQEVLNNIKSHSDATEVEMTTNIDAAGKFHLSIVDNGHAFSPDGSTPKGRGIANIKARASLIKARVQWLERRKGGNRFTLTL